MTSFCRHKKHFVRLLLFAVVGFAVVCMLTSWVSIPHVIRVFLGLNTCKKGLPAPEEMKHARKAQAVPKMAIRNAEIQESVSRDVTWQERWPEVEGRSLAPEEVPPTVHYVWCGADRQFTFRHYLGVLSALRILKPLRLLFHFTHSLPVLDQFMYNDWFQELNDTVPFLELHPLHVRHACGSKDMLQSISQLLSSDGGVYVGENVILAQPPPSVADTAVWTAGIPDRGEGDVIPGIMLVKASFRDVRINASDVRVPQDFDSKCLSVDDFNELGGPGPKTQCVALNPRKTLYPRDIWGPGASTPFAQLARWLFYGKRAPQEVKADVTRPIPRVTHYVRIQSTQYPMYTEELSFAHFIGILSALHVAGFERVYLHVTHALSGQWWEELSGEKVTVVKLHPPRSVFQQDVAWIKHKSDLSRYNIVYKYGGAYQDFDTVWTSYLPDSLLAYPALFSPAISHNGLWPGGISVGLFLARSRAPFLRHFLKTYKKYRKGMPLYNSVTMSYRTMERYPDTVRVEPRLQVICFGDVCHPHWLHPPLWDLRRDGGRGYNWTETHAVHVPHPKPPKSLASPHALREGRDMLADIGRWVLKKSGRSRLLGDST